MTIPVVPIIWKLNLGSPGIATWAHVHICMYHLNPSRKVIEKKQQRPQKVLRDFMNFHCKNKFFPHNLFLDIHRHPRCCFCTSSLGIIFINWLIASWGGHLATSWGQLIQYVWIKWDLRKTRAIETTLLDTSYFPQQSFIPINPMAEKQPTVIRPSSLLSKWEAFSKAQKSALDPWNQQV